jgi:hypothetical protein
MLRPNRSKLAKEAGVGETYARVNNTSDGESARPQAQRLPRCVRLLAYWYSALIVRQSQVGPLLPFGTYTSGELP